MAYRGHYNRCHSLTSTSDDFGNSSRHMHECSKIIFKLYFRVMVMCIAIYSRIEGAALVIGNKLCPAYLLLVQLFRSLFVFQKSAILTIIHCTSIVYRIMIPSRKEKNAIACYSHISLISRVSIVLHVCYLSSMQIKTLVKEGLEQGCSHIIIS